MSYLVLARKCRPQTFDEVVGQTHVTRTLSNAIKMDRVAHGFLFSGVRGVGKTSLARILAKALNCEKGPTPDPCGVCESCKAIAAGTAVDVIEIDGASNNSVDDIRDLRETIPYRPALGRFKIYVIDEVHMLSVSAFNALLKTLEEPPPHVKFIFATTEPHKIPNTILSRCQRYDFRRIPTGAIVDRIRQILADEGMEADEGALAIIGREAEGSMRDSLSILDQVLAAGAQRITAQSVADLLGVVSRRVFYDLSAALLDGDPRRALEVVRDVDNQGFDLTTFSRGLLEHLRNLVVASVCGDDTDLLDLPDDEIADVQRQAGSTSRDNLHRIFKHFSEAYEEVARSQYQRILLEATVARLADMSELIPADDLIARLEALSSDPTGGGPRGPAGGGGPGSGSGRSRGAAGRTPEAGVDRGSAAPAESATGASKAEREGTVEIPAPHGSPTGVVDLTHDWEKLLAEFSRSHPAKSSIFERGLLVLGERPDAFVLRFDERDQFTAQRAREPELQRELAAFLANRAGAPVTIRVECCDLKDTTTLARERLEETERTRKLIDEAREHPVVKGAMSTFGGTISRVQLAEDAKQEKG